MKRYTLEDLVKERERAMKICLDFLDKHLKETNERSGWQSVISKKQSETARNIHNAISGRTGLTANTPISVFVSQYHTPCCGRCDGVNDACIFDTED